jgi:hypothetical protein
LASLLDHYFCEFFHNLASPTNLASVSELLSELCDGWMARLCVSCSSTMPPYGPTSIRPNKFSFQATFFNPPLQLDPTMPCSWAGPYFLFLSDRRSQFHSRTRNKSVSTSVPPDFHSAFQFRNKFPSETQKLTAKLQSPGTLFLVLINLTICL